MAAGVRSAEIASGCPADIGVAGSVHGDGVAVVPIARTDLGRPELVAAGVELAQERIAIAGGVGVVPPTDIGVAQSVHGDGVAFVPIARADLRRPDLVAAGVELAQERIAHAGVGLAENASGLPADIDVAGSIHGDGAAAVVETRTDLGRPEFAAAGVELAQERIVKAGVRPAKITFGLPADIDVAGRVHGD